jgi:hypothetical protein
MKLSDWTVIRQAGQAILIDLDQEMASLLLPNPLPQTLDDLRRYLIGVRFEIDLGMTLNFTFGALMRAGQAIGEAHRLAVNVLVAAPTAQQINEVENDLRVIHQAVLQDQRFDAALALAGAVADIAGQLKK